jgi:hypothetical protein
MDAKSIADSLLHATAQQDAAKATVDAYREALTDVFRRLHTDHGIRGSIDTDAGKARWDTPDPEAVITDWVSFMQWAEDRTAVRFTINGSYTAEAEAALTTAGVPYTKDQTLRDGDRDALLKTVTATDDGQAITPDGEVLPFVEWREKPARLVVTVDSGLKTEQRRRAREAVIAEVAAE